MLFVNKYIYIYIYMFYENLIESQKFSLDNLLLTMNTI